MSLSDPSVTSEKLKRRRVTTACTSCRDHRVKCDRIRPACGRCRKKAGDCTYTDDDERTVEFAEPLRLNNGGRTTAPSGSWNSIMENQVQTVRQSSVAGSDLPTWAIADAAEPSSTISTKYYIKLHPNPISSIGADFYPRIRSNFPPQQLCQPFFDSFLSGVHPTVPVCYTLTLQQEYTMFWNTLCPSTLVEILVLVLSVLFTGSANCHPRDTEQSSIFMRLYDEILSQIDISTYQIKDLIGTRQIFQGYLIMNTFKANQLAPFASYGFLPQAIRLAQSLRYNVESKILEPVELEVRRRIWWHLVYLDVESIIANGLTPIIPYNGYTIKMPSLTHDYKSPSDMGSASLESFSSMMVAVQGHYQWAHHMQKWFENLPTQDEVSHFKALMETMQALLPKDNTYENIWARSYLKMQIDRAYCMLGLRFWHLDRFTETECHSEIVETARSFLAHYLHLCAINNCDGATIQPFSWFTPGLVQPLHALIILLAHLLSCKDIGSEAVLSRGLLDDVFSLRVDWILRGSVLPTKARLPAHSHMIRTNPRYLILVDLRKRVWSKLGWDKDGLGKDPWSGRLDHHEIAQTTDAELEAVPECADALKPDSVDQDYKGNGDKGLDATMVEAERLWDGDPLDMMQWDEWNELTQGLFAS